ncbi:DUF4440 domain-containing protein [Pseudoflavitalea sp. X16]|uniref:YybH family protein n=1 Tax=Paraflavitalea devenefica TaxID=2716334 RepID=UPI00142055A9|nr:DUF4440 domain-containing protein [Paraflavitalea devenefica]NII27034.1 DUF4440 domain-containing protein [Paraflavitalea devenefica]
MKMVASFMLITGSIVLLLACNTARDEKATVEVKDTTAFDLSAARSWIENDNAKFAEELKRGDSVAVAAHYASDAWVMMSNSEPAKGKDIASAWGQVVRMGIKDIKIETVDLIGNADLLAETGTYELYGEGNKLLDKGKYVVIWKQENGTWKIYRDIGNSNLPVMSVK